MRGEVYTGGHHLATYVNSTTYFIHADWLGTERVRSTLAAASCETTASLPFGDGQSSAGACTDVSPLHFTGKLRDTETNLDDFGARYYSSQLGRWNSPDWAASAEAVPYANFGDPQSLNLYGYVRNNPTRNTDADGHCDWCQKLKNSLIGLGWRTDDQVKKIFDYYRNLPPNEKRLLDRQIEETAYVVTAAGTVVAMATTSLPEGKEAEGEEGAAGEEVGATAASGSSRPSGSNASSASATARPGAIPNFQTPTNPPQEPPANIPQGWRVRLGPPRPEYPNGYWKLEKPMQNGGWQAIDPSTMKPGTEAQTHIPLPPKT